MSELEKVFRDFLNQNSKDIFANKGYEDFAARQEANLENAKQKARVLMLETFGKALEAKSVEEMGEIFRKEVESL